MPVPEKVDEGPRRSERDEHRAQMGDLKALANRLAKLPPGVRRALPLDADVLEHLDLLANAEMMPHRRRLLMRAKLLLSGMDLVKLQAALAGDTPAATLDREIVRWRTRIVAGDDQVIQAFVEAYPGADRQGIRTNAREARGQGPAAARAQTRLLQQLRAAAAVVAEPVEALDESEASDESEESEE